MSDKPEFELRIAGPEPVVTLTGTFDDRADDVLIGAFQQIEKHDPKSVVLNASGAAFIGNWIVGQLVSHLVRLRKQEVRIKIVAERGFEKNTEWWLRTMKLDQVFETFKTETEALESASNSRDG